MLFFRKIVLFILLFTATISTNAVNRVDSLIKVLSKAQNDTERIDLNNKIAQEYIEKYPEKALDYAHKASVLAREVGYHHGLIESLINIGEIYRSSENYPQAIKHFEKAHKGSEVLSDSSMVHIIRIDLAELYYKQKLYKKASYYIEKVDTKHLPNNSTLSKQYYYVDALIKVKLGKIEDASTSLMTLLKEVKENSAEAAEIYNQLGIISQQNADYTKAQNYFYKALKIYETTHNYTQQAETFSNLADLNMEQNLLDNALDFNFKALAIINELGKLSTKSKIFDDIGLTYLKMRKFDRAIDYYAQSLMIRENLGDPLLISESYSNMANVYEAKKDISKAIIYHFKSIKIREESNDNEAISDAYLNLARLYFNNKQYDKSIETATKAFEASDKTGNTWLMQESAKILAESNQKQGNFKEGYLFYETYVKIKDSLHAQQKSDQIARLETLYKTDKKEKEIALLNKEKELQDLELHKQALLRNGLVIGIGLLLIVFIFIYRAYQQKSDASKLLVEQKALIEKKNKDIVASLTYAKRIQDSILPKKRKLNDLVSDSFVLFMPKEIVSGDFYWFEKVENKSIFAVVDCTGHGVPGAFMSMIATELLNDIIKTKKITDPSEILKKLHNRVVAGLKKNENDSFTVDGMDIAICVIEENSNTLAFSSSGRPLVHISGNNVSEISGSRFPIGMVTRKERIFETKYVPFEKDDLFYIFTDGITDQFNETHSEKMTRDGLIEQLKQIKSNSLKVQYRLLKDYFHDWKKEAPQMDDVCMIGVRV